MSESIEHAKEAIEHAIHEAEHGGSRAAPRIAVLIAALAAVLALSDMAAKSAQNNYLTSHIAVSDDYNFYQAKNARASIYDSQATLLESLPNAADPAIVAKIAKARQTEARMRDDPQSGNGMKQLGEVAKAREEVRDHQFHRYHLFEGVVGVLQITIVLASVSVVTRVHWLAWAAGILGVSAAGFAGMVAGGIL